MELVTSSARDSRSAVYFGIVFSCLPTMSRANLMIAQRISLLLIIFAQKAEKGFLDRSVISIPNMLTGLVSPS